MSLADREERNLGRQDRRGDRVELVSCAQGTPFSLDQISFPAVVIDSGFEIVLANQAYRDRFNRGRRVCGRRCFEVSHHLTVPCQQLGESCPVMCALRSGNGQEALHVHHSRDGEEEYEHVSAQPLNTGDVSRPRCLEIISPSVVASLRSRVGEDRALVGRSAPFQQMLDLVTRVAPSLTTVLMLGESGTGKELVAKALHKMSPRSNQPFVPVDCSGLTETLFESELFGHEKGSFTGAHSRKGGLVEAASGGTLFLDEVGDIPLPLQVKLLRLIETKAFRRVGGVQQLHSDFRLVCATHRDLPEMVRAGTFRADLYYRISSFPIDLPPLRERIDDLPLLADVIFGRLGCENRCRIPPESMAALGAYSFPGNVRELANILERACLLSDSGSILIEHLPPACTHLQPGADRRGFPLAASEPVVPLDDFESRYIQWACRRFAGSRAELAEQLGISERTLYRRLRGH